MWPHRREPPQAPPSLRFSRQEHWSGLLFPSPMHESEKWKWSRSVLSDSSRPRGLQPTRLLRPWDFPGKSTGVGCHCLKYLWPKKLSDFFEVTHLVNERVRIRIQVSRPVLFIWLVVSCLDVSDSWQPARDCSPPGSSVLGILQVRILEWVATPFSRGSSWSRIKPRSPALQADFFFFFFLTIWATREDPSKNINWTPIRF